MMQTFRTIEIQSPKGDNKDSEKKNKGKLRDSVSPW